MTVPSRERGQLLVLLAAWLFFGGSASSALVVYDRSPSEIKKAVKRVIKDEGRRGVILSEIGQWESDQERQDKQVGEYRKELLKSLQRKDAQRSEVESTTARMDVRFVEMDRNFLDLRFRVKEQVTRAEWAELVSPSNR
jgi:hypothetical protein